MQPQVIRDLGTLDSARWDALAHPSIYLSYDWLRARSRTLGGGPRFVLVSADDGTPLVGAPGYLLGASSHPGYDPARALTVDDLTVGGEGGAPGDPGDQAALDALRAALERHAGELRPALVVSAPGRMGGVSYGRGLDAGTRRAATGVTVDAVERQAAADGAAVVCWLYFVEGADDMLDSVLRERGYLGVAVEAECYLDVRWDSFDGYLASFKAKRRKQIRTEMAALADSGARVEMHGGEALGPELARLELQWRAKYGRSPALDGVVADYDELRAHFGDELRVFVARLDGRPVAFTVWLVQGDTWYSRFGGFDYSAGKLFLYFNVLFYEPIRTAIEAGATTMRYSLKSYDAKRSRGCSLRNVLAYLRLPEGLPAEVYDGLRTVDRLQRARFAAISSAHTRHDTP